MTGKDRRKDGRYARLHLVQGHQDPRALFTDHIEKLKIKGSTVAYSQHHFGP